MAFRAAWLVPLTVWAFAEPVDQAKLKELYDKAFSQYSQGEYSAALHTWNDVLRLDPEQKTARKMIRDVREEINRKNRERLDKLYARVREGRYQKALLELQSLIEEDESHPRYGALQAQLEEVASIAPEEPAAGRAWRMARLGLEGALGRKPNRKLAYNALRYALELEPKEERFKRLLEWLAGRWPDLSGSDSVTPGMTLIEYKHFVALDQIYDGKYHLAVDTLNEVLDLEPEDLLALKRLGSAYFSLGRRAKAREAWTRALRLAPQDPQLKKFLKKLDSSSAGASSPS